MKRDEKSGKEGRKNTSHGLSKVKSAVTTEFTNIGTLLSFPYNPFIPSLSFSLSLNLVPGKNTITINPVKQSK